MKYLLDMNTCIDLTKDQPTKAYSLGVTLVTNNEREFRRIPDLVVENWSW